ncbi:MAG TPA: hypothetical protein VN663_22775 [Ramlibacter sp.]|nr:hypothetical protein [Ramlibacter sp.]
MAENNNQPARGSAPTIDPATVALGLLNAGLTAHVALMLTIPVPATDVMNVLCEHIGKLLALVEPEQLRNSILGEIRHNLPGVLNRHVEARMRTPGGVLIPEGVGRVQ